MSAKKFSRFSIGRQRLELYVNDGLSDTDIAALFGCSAPAIKDRRADFGIASRHERKKINPVRVAELAGQGKSDREIAAELGFTRSSVRDRRIADGIPPGCTTRGGRRAGDEIERFSRNAVEADTEFERLLNGRKFTSLNLRTAGAVLKPARPQEFSYSGSAAAMCVA